MVRKSNKEYEKAASFSLISIRLFLMLIKRRNIKSCFIRNIKNPNQNKSPILNGNHPKSDLKLEAITG